MTNDEADEILAQLASKKEFHNANNNPRNITEAATLNGVAQGILKGRSLDTLPAVRDFLGEYSGGSTVISGPSGKVRDRTVAEQREGIERRAVETIDKMSKAVYKKEFFDNVVRHNNTLNPNNKFLFDKRPVGASPKDFIQIENNPKKFGASCWQVCKRRKL